MRSYRERDDSGQRHAAAFCHFFLDDYRFESVWTKPDTALNRLHGFYGALTPDFSLYADWPLAVQQWNHYRRQWLGRYWQEHGLRVISIICCNAKPPAKSSARLKKPQSMTPMANTALIWPWRSARHPLKC